VAQSVYLFGLESDDNTRVMWDKLRRVKSIHVELVYCPPLSRELYRFPFLKDERGERFFGVEGIQGFVDRQSLPLR